MPCGPAVTSPHPTMTSTTQTAIFEPFWLKRSFSGPCRPRATSAISPMATCFAAVSSHVSATPAFGDLQVRVTAAQEKMAKWEAPLAALHGVDGPKVESLRAVLKRVKDVKVQPVDVQGVRFLVEGPRTSHRVGREAHDSECEHSQCGEAAGGVAINAAVFPTSTSRRRSRIPAVAREGCPIAGTVGRCQASHCPDGRVSKRSQRREDFVPNCVDELQSGSEQSSPTFTMQCCRGDPTRSPGSATSWAMQHNSGSGEVGTLPSMVTNIAN